MAGFPDNLYNKMSAKNKNHNLNICPGSGCFWCGNLRCIFADQVCIDEAGEVIWAERLNYRQSGDNYLEI